MRSIRPGDPSLPRTVLASWNSFETHYQTLTFSECRIFLLPTMVLVTEVVHWPVFASPRYDSHSFLPADPCSLITLLRARAASHDSLEGREAKHRETIINRDGTIPSRTGSRGRGRNLHIDAFLPSPDSTSKSAEVSPFATTNPTPARDAPHPSQGAQRLHLFIFLRGGG